MALFDFSKKSLYSRGVGRYADLLFLSLKDRKLAKDDVRHSRLLLIDAGKWAPIEDLNWATAGMCMSLKPNPELVVVSDDGQVFVYAGKTTYTERIEPAPSDLRAAAEIEGVPYACGMKREVFRRDARGKWKAMHAAAWDGKSICGFEAIGGFSGKNLYAVGWEGEIWQYTKSKWFQRTSPVNAILTGVCCAPDKTVYVCGQNGSLLRGHEDTWEVLEQDDVEDDFWDIRWFKDKLYVASMSALYVLKGKKLVPVNFGKDAPESCYKLTDAEGIMWSIGQEDLFSFDGKTWTRWD